jgi:hypothetical protein
MFVARVEAYLQMHNAFTGSRFLAQCARGMLVDCWNGAVLVTSLVKSFDKKGTTFNVKRRRARNQYTTLRGDSMPTRVPASPGI